MATYDINGNVISGAVTPEEVSEAYLEAIASGKIKVGAVIGATLSYSNVSSETEAGIKNAYAQMLEKYSMLGAKAIPFFATADQHGTGFERHRLANNIDVDGLEFVNIGLGDVSPSGWHDDIMNSAFSRTKQIKNFINVVGNHDANYDSEKLEPSKISKVFRTTNLSRVNANDSSTNYVAYDSFRNVKYVVIDPYVINADGTGHTKALTGNAIDFIIEELTKNDGYDIVILTHWYLGTTGTDGWKNRDGSDYTSTTDNIFLNIGQMCSARRNKTAGTITDVDGVSHSYDFSSCESRLLCCLHGHEHAEMYTHLVGMLMYCVNFAVSGYSVFGLIDRENDKLYIWQTKDSTVDNVLELSI